MDENELARMVIEETSAGRVPRYQIKEWMA